MLTIECKELTLVCLMPAETLRNLCDDVWKRTRWLVLVRTGKFRRVSLSKQLGLCNTTTFQKLLLHRVSDILRLKDDRLAVC